MNNPFPAPQPSMGGFEAFHADQTIGESRDFSTPIDEGWYEVIIKKGEVKQTKAGTGFYLNLQFEITGGEFDGRYFFCRLNLVNPSPKAVDIARRDLSRIMNMVGVKTLPNPANPVELIGKNLQLHWAANRDGDLNIRGYKKSAAMAHATPNIAHATPKAATPAATPAAAEKPPWAM